MGLPIISPVRLQRVVADVEFDTKFASLEDLCEVVSQTQWATNLELNGDAVKALIAKHSTTYNPFDESVAPIPRKVVEKVEEVEEPKVEEVKAAKVPVAKVTVTYDVGGKGKKQCPKCKKFVGNKTSVCACDHQFVAKTKVVKEDEDDEEPVKTISGIVRDKGFPELDFKVDASVEVEAEVVDAKVVHRRLDRDKAKYRIHTPSGGCPHRLTDTDPITVEQWAENCRKTFLDRNGGWLGLPALKYMVREYYNMFPAVANSDNPVNPDYKKI